MKFLNLSGSKPLFLVEQEVPETQGDRRHLRTH